MSGPQHASLALVALRAAVFAAPLIAFIGAVVWALVRDRDLRRGGDPMQAAHGDQPHLGEGHGHG